MQNIVGFRKKPKIKKRWGRNITLHAMDEMDSLPAAWIFYFHGHLARVPSPVLLGSSSPVPEYPGYGLVDYRLLNMRTWSQSRSAAYTLWNIRNWLVNTGNKPRPEILSIYNDLYTGGFARKGYPKLLDFRYKRGKGRLKLHEVCERVGKSVISFSKKLQNWITDAFHGYEKVEETLWWFTHN